jgi:hypothetical protein
MALEISPTFVVIHFTAANIHAARVHSSLSVSKLPLIKITSFFLTQGDVPRALSFYQSTLALQPSFEPARQQLIDLQCKQILMEQQQSV